MPQISAPIIVMSLTGDTYVTANKTETLMWKKTM
jgi:hypothetical protein